MRVLISQKVVLSEIETAPEDTSVEKKLHACLKSDVLRPILCLLQEYFWFGNNNVDEEVHRKKSKMLSSAYVSSCKVLSLKNKVSSDSVIVDETERRFFHHIVAADSYYGCPTGRFYAVTTEADNAETIFTSKHREFSVWSAMVFAFIRVIRVYAKKKYGAVFTIQKTVVLVDPIGATRWPSFNSMR